MSAELELPARLDHVAAQSLIGALSEHRGSDLTLDAADVTHFGSLAAQTLLIAGASWRADGRTLLIENLSAEATEQLSVLGLSAEALCRGEPA